MLAQVAQPLGYVGQCGGAHGLQPGLVEPLTADAARQVADHREPYLGDRHQTLQQVVTAFVALDRIFKPIPQHLGHAISQDLGVAGGQEEPEDGHFQFEVAVEIRDAVAAEGPSQVGAEHLRDVGSIGVQRLQVAVELLPGSVHAGVRLVGARSSGRC